MEKGANMKFDYVIGNPPYQYPNGVKSAGDKLYIPIALKMFDLLTTNGIMSFITPKAVLRIKNKQIIKEFDKHLKFVDFTANERFNIGQNVIQWRFARDSTTGIEVCTKAGNRYKVLKTHEIYDEGDYNLINILNKVDYTKNSSEKMEIVRGTASSHLNVISLAKCHIENGENTTAVLCSRKKFSDCIGYVNNKDLKGKNTVRTITVPYGRPWSDTNLPMIYDGYVDEMFFIMKDNKDLENKLIYLKSKLITYCVNEYTHKIKSDGKNNFLYRVPEVDFSKEWSDEELYKEFKLTEQEIKEIEDWYKLWKK